MEPDDGCRDCGTLTAEHDYLCVSHTLDLIDQYAGLRELGKHADAGDLLERIEARIRALED